MPHKHQRPRSPETGTPDVETRAPKALTDGELTDGESGNEHSFLTAIEGQSQLSRRESSAAFTAEQVRPISSRELLTEQLKISQQVAKLSDKIDRLRSYALIANLASAAIICSFVALGSTLYLRPELISQLVAPNAALTTEPLTPSTSEPLKPNLALDTYQGFNIDNDTDYEFYARLRNLHLRTRSISPTSGLKENRIAANEYYLAFIDDLLDTVEDAAKANVAPELMQAFVNLSEVGKARRAADEVNVLDAATQDKLDQIKRVLRARDIRSNFPQ
ncbi:MAG: hypothetical protein P8L85_21600 [Rubripirellula sp.]|nr:hypothetical protein [Rubripirellula sp.]